MASRHPPPDPVASDRLTQAVMTQLPLWCRIVLRCEADVQEEAKRRTPKPLLEQPKTGEGTPSRKRR